MIRGDSVVRKFKGRDVSAVADPTDARIVGILASKPINTARQEGTSVGPGADSSTNRVMGTKEQLNRTDDSRGGMPAECTITPLCSRR